MVNTRHSHCFSNSQLQIIIDSYLNMAPYSSALVQAIKNYTKTYQQQLEMHRRDKPHPIKIYTKDSYNNKNILEEQKQCSNDNHRELRATYASNTLRYYYLYPLECVIQMLLSEQFYSFLPQNIIVNGLQTQTNLRIIIQTLKIVSEDMGKRIRSTISGKQLEKIEEDDKILENDTQKQLTQPLKTDKVQTSGFFSIVNIQVEEEDQVVLLKPPLLLKNEQKLVRTNIAGTQRQINIDRDVAESDCHFCQGYLIYLYETIGQKPLDEDINRISMQSVRCLRLIAKAVNYFTMYLEQTGQTKILNDIHLINKILNTMGLVITEDIYSSQLNPKNKQPPPLIRRTPKNLIEDLQPYFTNEISNKDWEKYYSVDQLFRMIIYCPTTQEVKQQLKQSKIDHFQKDPVLKSYEKEDIVKKLLKKECEEMKQFEMERIMIAENTVNLKPVYKQLQFPEELLSPQNLQPTHHNVHNSSRHNTSKPLNKQKSFPFSININTHKIQSKSPIASKKQSKIFMAQMGSCISSSKIQKKGSTQLNKRNRQNYKQLNTIDVSLQNSNISTITKALKLNMLKETSTAPKLVTTSTEVYDILTDKNHSQMKEIKEVKPAKNEGQNGLTNQQFRRILIHAYNRSQTLHRGDSSYTQQYTHNSSMNNYLSTSSIKMGSKKNNGYNTSLSNYIGRKQQQEQVESIEKQEKELYNKQQLNGFHVKSQIQEEIRSGKAIVIDDYKGVRVTKQFQVPDFYRKMNKHDTKYTKYTKYTQYTTARNKLQKQGKTKQNVIQETSTKYNQTGLIRNQKYNKCIKNELINHRQSFLLANQKQNEAKNRLFLTCLKKKVTETDFVPDVKRMYELELQAIKEQRQIQNNFLPQSKAKIQQYF